MTDTKPINCLSSHGAIYPQHKVTINPRARSEAASNDDYEGLGFAGFGNKNQDSISRVIWANETKALAERSIITHAAGIPLKIASHFATKIGNEKGLTAKVLFALERLISGIAISHRNRIYSHKILKDGKEVYDDNLGAEEFAASEDTFGDTNSYRLGQVNNFLQVFIKPTLIPLLGLLSPKLANDIDWAILTPIDSAWWRNMSLNSGFYTGFMTDMVKKFISIFSNSRQDLPSLKFMWNKFNEHLKKSKEIKNSNQNPKDKKDANEKTLMWSKHMDQATALLLPFISFPSNFIGNTFRPIARRLELTGFLRNATRILSVADRSILGINYWFRFYKPEVVAEQEMNNSPNKTFNEINTSLSNIHYSKFYLFSLVGDILDLPFTIFEDRIKASPLIIEHSIDILRILKDSAFNIFWSGRRIRSANQVLKANLENSS